MKVWFTAAELAALALPGLPGTKRRINAVAARESWPHRDRSGRGGGREYPRDALPREARDELAARDVSASAKTQLAVAANAVLVDIAGLVGNKRTRAETRLCIVRLANAYREHAGIDLTPADLRFADEWNAGRIEAEPWLREALPKISGPSLRRWRISASQGDTGGLAGRYRTDRQQGLIDANPVYREFIVALIAHAPHYRPGSVRDAMKARFRGLPIPSAKTLQRWMNRWREENPRAALLLENPDAARSKYKIAIGDRSAFVVRINQLWESDATPADAQCIDGRYTIVGVIDVFTRRARLVVTRTSKSEAVLATVRKSIVDLGMPETVKTDNGADFTSRWTSSAFAALGIRQNLCTPYDPTQKPHIERFFKTMSHELLEILPGFKGHSVAQAQAIRARAGYAKRQGEGDDLLFSVSLTAAQLQAALDAWLLGKYEQRPHEGLDGATPHDLAAAHAAHARPVPDVRALDVLLSEPKVRVVGKKGIALDRAEFWDEALVPLIGHRVDVLMDAADAGRIVVHKAGGAFVCVATDLSLAGTSRAELAARASAVQRNLDRETRAVFRILKREYRPELSAGEVLAAAAAAAQAAGTIVPAGIPYSSHAIEEAAKAAAALDAPRGWEPKVIAHANEAVIDEPAPTRATRIDWDDVEDTKGWPFEQVKAAPDRVFFLWVHQNPDQAEPHHKELLAQAIAADPYVAQRIAQSETITQERIENAALYGAKTRKAAAG
jgi:putative transposase